jgi:perosamine synthetase
MIPIYTPYLPKSSLKYAHDALDSTWVSSSGKYIELATDALRELLGVKYVQLVNNGTSATHLVAKSLLFKNPRIKKVIVPNNVYVAAWNAFLYEGIELIPIDADINTWNFNADFLPSQLQDDTSILAVHNIGNIIDIPALVERYGLNMVVEDNCEGFMGMHRNSYSGTCSLASSLSFFGNKTITSGEGGAVITNDEDVFEFISSVRGQGQAVGKRYIHDKLGYNYRMTNIQAAILLGQLEMLPEILEKKQMIFEFYRKNFSMMDNVSIQEIDPSTIHSNWMMGIRIAKNSSYENIQDFLKKKGIDTRPMFYPMSAHSYLECYANSDNESVAQQLSRECVVLPSFPELSVAELDHIVRSVQEFIRK